uniref:Uncharacterized protein n=1 Tax=Kalanchoe fedtschenkoi TaxID=63787 RepID=A0A7N0ZX52_KALFE
MNNTFGVTIMEESSMHIRNSLKLCNTFKVANMPNDVLHLHLFPFSLWEKAKKWPRSPLEGTPLNGESLYKVWGHYKRYHRRYPHHGMSRHYIVHLFYFGVSY